MIQATKRLAGPRATVQLRSLLRGYGLPRWGNLRRTAPFSSTYGFERGTTVDRHYLHQFLDDHRGLITGDVLEVQTGSYTQQFGHDVRRADTFDIVPALAPTYLCDFAHCESVISGDARPGAVWRKRAARCAPPAEEGDPLAYPWGKRGADYTTETVDLAGSAGIRIAFSTHASFARPSEDPLQRSRFVIMSEGSPAMSEVSPAELVHRIAYTWPR
jgi:hypothetical protein